MSELIEKLKKNERPFGLCSEEEREVFSKVGRANCEYWSGSDGWVSAEQGLGFVYQLVYRIEADYQPESEPDYIVFGVKADRSCYRFNDNTQDLVDVLSYVAYEGVQFEGQKNNDLWYMNPNMFIEPNDRICYVGASDDKKAVPVRVRFRK